LISKVDVAGTIVEGQNISLGTLVPWQMKLRRSLSPGDARNKLGAEDVGVDVGLDGVMVVDMLMERVVVPQMRE
jgi:hypothetical protein